MENAGFHMIMRATERADGEILTISQLNKKVGSLLENSFSRIWIKGEISNLTMAASGHWYFSIKDERAAVKAVMFRGRVALLDFAPKVGEKFEFRVNVTLYEPRGDYQVQVDTMRRAGLGDLHEAFLRLKAELEAEGLFDQERKKAVAPMPRAIGVITSLGAAALRDVLTALARRAPHVPVIIYPTPVQGAEAVDGLVRALAQAVGRAEVDTILLVRGGGSLEDLWSFNAEVLARAIAASPIPVISGVGHETDFTIADFVADLRAPTPTAAAELSCRTREECLLRTQSALQALTVQMHRRLERLSQRLDSALIRLVSPEQRVARQRDRLQGLRDRVIRATAVAQQHRMAGLLLQRTRLVRATPSIDALRENMRLHARRLALASAQNVQRQARRLAGAQQTLQALSPRHILERGYAIVRNERGEIVKNAVDLGAGERLGVELGRGTLRVEVLDAHPLL